MNELPAGLEIVSSTAQQRECSELRLVLSAVGIASEARQFDGRWHLLVSREHADWATAELAAYRQENPYQPQDATKKIALYQGAIEAVTVYAIVIMAIATLAARRTLGYEWLTAGWMHAESVTAGQWWRTVTALTLHMDASHLVANLIFGSMFGLLAGRLLGGGVAWFVIVTAGATGNLINAFIQRADHTSIGASTAVFAALGSIVAHSLRPRAAVQEKRFVRWSPLIGGILLLAFTGMGGERTDVAAHVAGFGSGLLFGWLSCRLPERWLNKRLVQLAAGVLTIVLVGLAWYLALTANARG